MHAGPKHGVPGCCIGCVEACADSECVPPEILYLTDDWGTIELRRELTVGGSYIWRGCQDATFDVGFISGCGRIGLDPDLGAPYCGPVWDSYNGEMPVRLSYSVNCPIQVTGGVGFQLFMAVPSCSSTGNLGSLWLESNCSDLPPPGVGGTSYSRNLVITNCVNDENFETAVTEYTIAIPFNSACPQTFTVVITG
jgi:hypothetical protein